jgi:hypothetical protein
MRQLFLNLAMHILAFGFTHLLSCLTKRGTLELLSDFPITAT